MAKTIESIEGIGVAKGRSLRACGCHSVAKLLELGATRAGRKKLAAKSGISERQILKAVNQADLFRISGIASQYAELLEAAGVDTVKELRNRRPETLAAKLHTVNEARRLVRQVPALSKVKDWVRQAKSLKPAIKY